MASTPSAITNSSLLSLDHRIIEKGMMDHRPFGVDESGQKIRDVSGISVRALATYLEESIAQHCGPAAGAGAVQLLCDQLNDRIADAAYHVTPASLKNHWNSYSYEFVMYSREFCESLAGDPAFHFKAAQKGYFPPILAVLMRHLPIAQCYRRWPEAARYFSPHIIAEVKVRGRLAILRAKLTDHVCQQFGPYRKRCVWMWCQ